MQTVESLRRQLDVAEDLRDIVRTMKTLAAVSIRQAERAVHSLGAYFGTVEQALQVLVRKEPGLQRLSHETTGSSDMVLVFGSGQGLCGRFDESLIGHVRSDLLRRVGEEATFVAIGARIAARLEQAGLPIEHTFEVPLGIGAIPREVGGLLEMVDQRRRAEKLGRVFLAHHAPMAGTRYLPRTQQLLPLDRDWLERLQSDPWPTRSLPSFTMSGEDLLAAVIQQYLFVSLVRAFAESAASEHASRLTAMQAAERNIEERIEELAGRLRRRRQQQITEEVLDVTAGYRAVKGARRRGEVIPT